MRLFSLIADRGYFYEEKGGMNVVFHKTDNKKKIRKWGRLKCHIATPLLRIG